MRKGGLIALLLICLILIFFIWLFSDKIVEKNLEKIGARLFGTRVELSGVHLNLIKMNLSWKTLQIPDPENTWENIIQTGFCNFKIDIGELLKKRLHIEKFYITELRFHTRRSSNGALIIKKKRKHKEKTVKPEILKKVEYAFKKEKKKVPLFNPEKYLFILDKEDLIKNVEPQTPARVKSLKEKITSDIGIWDIKVKEIGGRVESVSKEVNDYINSIDLKGTPSSIKELNKRIRYLSKKYNEAESLIKKIKNIGNEIDNLKRDFITDYGKIHASVNKIDEWVLDDYKRILNNLKLPDLSDIRFAELIFGREILHRLERVVSVVSKVRSYLNMAKDYIPRKKIPERRKGEDIVFVVEKDKPRVWIEDVKVTGYTKRGIEISGSILNITDRQKLLGKPTSLEIGGRGLNGEKMILNGVFNYLGKTSREKFLFTFDGFNLVGLLDNRGYPVKFKNGRGMVNVSVYFEGNDIYSEIELEAGDVGLVYDDKVSRYIKNFVNSLLSGINNITLESSVNYVNGNLGLKIDSNIDEYFKESLENIYNENLGEAKRYVKIYLEDMKLKYSNEINSFLNDRRDSIEEKINKYRKVLSDEEERLKKEESRLKSKILFLKKELEDDLKKEAEKAGKEIEKKIKKDLKKELKTIF